MSTTEQAKNDKARVQVIIDEKKQLFSVGNEEIRTEVVEILRRLSNYNRRQGPVKSQLMELQALTPMEFSCGMLFKTTDDCRTFG